MSLSEKEEVIAINLIQVRLGVDPGRFAEFSASVDQPTCLTKDVVLAFDAYRVSPADSERLGADIIEVMHLRSWPEWEHVRDHDPELRPVTLGFEELADPASVRTLFVKPIRPA